MPDSMKEDLGSAAAAAPIASTAEIVRDLRWLEARPDMGSPWISSLAQRAADEIERLAALAKVQQP